MEKCPMPTDVSVEVRLALLEQQIELLKQQNTATQMQLQAMSSLLAGIDKQFSEAKGGWRVLLFLGTLMGGLTGVIGFFTGKVTGAS